MEPTPYSPLTPSTTVKATAGQRFLAYLIDVFVISLPVGILVAIAPSLQVVAQILVIAYIFLRDSLPFFNGQSIGKKAMSIKAVKEDTGASIVGDYGAGFIRNVSQMIPILNLVDAFMVFSSDGKRFGDKWAKTIVVKA